MPHPDAETESTVLSQAMAWLSTAFVYGWQLTPDGEPLCPKHGVAMTKRTRQGDTWHSHKVIDQWTGEELYCRAYPNQTSKADGYNV